VVRRVFVGGRRRWVIEFAVRGRMGRRCSLETEVVVVVAVAAVVVAGNLAE